MHYKTSVLLIICAFFSVAAYSQASDTLPKFSAKNVGNSRIIIGWTNPYEQVKQISIQRGFDSIGNYKTILSVVDPAAQQNGFVDTKAPNERMFYRLFIVFAGGNYIFTAAKRARIDTAQYSAATQNSKDSLAVFKQEPVLKRADWVPSAYVYTNKDGYVFINLPDADAKKYNVRFFEENGSPLFEIKDIKETALTLDKANFYHSGWYKFELYNDEKLVERNRFYLARGF